MEGIIHPAKKYVQYKVTFPLCSPLGLHYYPEQRREIKLHQAQHPEVI